MKDLALALFGFLTVASMLLHSHYSLIVKSGLQLSVKEVDEMFALANYKGRESLWMRARLFLPWVKLHSISERPKDIKHKVWAARLGGTGFLVGLIGMAMTQFLFWLSGA